MTSRLPDAQWLQRGSLARLLAALDRDGEEARVVGGAVRNALLSEPVGEIDVATTALPAEVMRRVEHAGFKAVPTGIDHGTVTVVTEGQSFEVTTLREDVETFGRKANVRFGRDWKGDAERRDFTINALSVSADGVVHDYVGGLADLDARRVRFIGHAEVRIREDYLRILRFFRFHAAYAEGAPNLDGLHAAIVLRGGLDTLSRERIRAELLKLLVLPRAAPTLVVMADAGLLGRVLGGVPLVPSFSKMASLEAAHNLEPDAIRRLGALAVLIVEDVERLAERLRLANSERDRLVGAADCWWRIGPVIGKPNARTLLYRVGPEVYRERVLLAWTHAEAGANDPAWHDLLMLPEQWTAPRFPLKAADFIARGVPKGPQLGAALAAAEQAWMAAGFPHDATALATIRDQAAGAGVE